MSDINELVHALKLADALALSVLCEAGSLPIDHLLRIRKDLMTAQVDVFGAALLAGVDLIDDHAEMDDRLRRAMTAIAKSKGVEVEVDPYASLDETEVEFGDGRIVQLKASEADLRVLATELSKREEAESLSDQLKRANLALAKAKLAAQQCEGFEPELRYLFATDPAIRARVREMVDARTKAA